MTPDERRARFAADVANAEPIVDIVDGASGKRLFKEFRIVLDELLGPAAPPEVRRRAIPDDAQLQTELARFQERLVDTLASILPFVILPSRPSVAPVPIGADVYLPIGYRLLLQVHGRTLQSEMVSNESDNLASALLAFLFEGGRRVPLWGCRGCARVFAVSRTGRPRAFCGAACKQSKIPSRSKRSEYQRRYRERLRERQLEKAIEIVQSQGSTGAEQAVAEAFPGRPRRWILNMLEVARRNLRASQQKPGQAKSGRRGVAQ